SEKGWLFLLLHTVTHLHYVRSAEQVSQIPAQVTVAEGRTASIHCNYTDSRVTVVHWYRQQPSTKPEKVISSYGDLERENQLSAWLNTKGRFGVFNISLSQTGDSALYYCAVEAQVHFQYVENIHNPHS
uniref:Ig-like domain-containing protein n=1 Tax=Lepisosteus oculatus TaxID=7918 RepID=W5MFY3_LEPOC